MTHRIEGVGLPNVYLTGGFKIEGEGALQTVAYFDLEGLYFSIAGCIARRSAPLTASEFRFLRKRLGMNQHEVGALVGKTSQAIAKWEKEKGSVPVADGMLVRLAWLSKFAPSDVAHVVAQMVNERAYQVAHGYLFAFEGNEWIEAATLADARDATAKIIGRAKAISSGYTSTKLIPPAPQTVKQTT